MPETPHEELARRARILLDGLIMAETEDISVYEYATGLDVFIRSVKGSWLLSYQEDGVGDTYYWGSSELLEMSLTALRRIQVLDDLASV